MGDRDHRFNSFADTLTRKLRDSKFRHNGINIIAADADFSSGLKLKTNLRRQAIGGAGTKRDDPPTPMTSLSARMCFRGSTHAAQLLMTNGLGATLPGKINFNSGI